MLKGKKYKTSDQYLSKPIVTNVTQGNYDILRSVAINQGMSIRQYTRKLITQHLEEIKALKTQEIQENTEE